MAWIYLCVLVICFLAESARGLDLSFIPNDENAPLPLSAKYRAALKRLCELTNDPSTKVTPELAEKKKVLAKMCAKLAKDEQNIASSLVPAMSPQRALTLLLTAGGSYLLWFYRNALLPTFKRLLGFGRRRGGAAGGYQNNCRAPTGDISPLSVDTGAVNAVSPINIVNKGTADEPPVTIIDPTDRNALREARLRKLAGNKELQL